MRVSQILVLVALPLVAAMRTAVLHHAQEPAAHLAERTTLVDNSQFNFLPFNLTNMGMECARASTDDLYDCELRFDWHDPNSVPENDINDCSCIFKWSWDGNSTEAGEKNTYSDQYTLCLKALPVLFEMRIASFNSLQAFELKIAHRYHDSENFTEPWDYPMTFAQPAIHLPMISREENLLRLYDAGPIYANITAISG